MMPHMTSEEINHLGRLSRIALTPAEAAAFCVEIDTILAYVSTVKNLAKGGVVKPTVGVRFNILRSDVVTVASGTHKAVLLEAMPSRQGDYLAVKKILNQPE
jgi:aspartyl/glutamyl-tRNA(Asn/Gln) amidotransferase C subunit